MGKNPSLRKMMKLCPAPIRLGVLLRQLDHRGVGARPADEAGAAGFAEGDAEFDAGHC